MPRSWRERDRGFGRKWDGAAAAGRLMLCAGRRIPMFETLEAYGHQITEFARAHEVWAAPIVFLLAFGESLAFISLLIPAWAALVGIGALIMAGDLNFWPIWIAASLGAALGDWLSYWIGLKLEYTVQHHWPLSRHPDLIPKGEAFVKKMGRRGHLHRPLLRTVARLGAAYCRDFRDAVLAVPARQFLLSLRVGGRAAHARRCRRAADPMDLGRLNSPRYSLSLRRSAPTTLE